MTPRPLDSHERVGDQAGWLMLAPALGFTLVFALYPVVDSFLLSLHRILLVLPDQERAFVGLANYRQLAADPVARQAFVVTLGFVALSTILEVLLGLGIALVIHEQFRGRGWVRAAALIPWAIPTVVASQMWRFIFNDQYGFANLLLFGDRIADYVPWLAYPGFAWVTIVLADVWKTSSFAGLLILAGLQLIPDDLYDAARIDGANAWRRFWYITLPLLRPALLLALLFRTIESFKLFDLVFLLTEGGPGTSTETIAVYVYRMAFQYFRTSQSSALAYILLFIVIVLTNLYLYFVKQRGQGA